MAFLFYIIPCNLSFDFVPGIRVTPVLLIGAAEWEVYVSVVVFVVRIAVVGLVSFLSVVADDSVDVLGLGDVVEYASNIFKYKYLIYT